MSKLQQNVHVFLARKSYWSAVPLSPLIRFVQCIPYNSQINLEHYISLYTFSMLFCCCKQLIFGAYNFNELLMWKKNKMEMNGGEWKKSDSKWHRHPWSMHFMCCSPSHTKKKKLIYTVGMSCMFFCSYVFVNFVKVSTPHRWVISCCFASNEQMNEQKKLQSGVKNHQFNAAWFNIVVHTMKNDRKHTHSITSKKRKRTREGKRYVCMAHCACDCVCTFLYAWSLNQLQTLSIASQNFVRFENKTCSCRNSNIHNSFFVFFFCSNDMEMDANKTCNCCIWIVAVLPMQFFSFAILWNTIQWYFHSFFSLLLASVINLLATIEKQYGFQYAYIIIDYTTSFSVKYG